MNTHHVILDFGKHKGELWTRVPADYLRWLANSEEVNHNVEMARAELDRRGTKVSHEVELSPHAIDKASLRVRKIWHQTALHQGEGLYSWLSRTATEALKSAGENPPDRIWYKGVIFVFRHGKEFPILKTVIRKTYDFSM